MYLSRGVGSQESGVRGRWLARKGRAGSLDSAQQAARALRFPGCYLEGPSDSGRRGDRRSGATALQFLILFVPVFFGLMGFAVDLGILYSVKGDLKTAASAMALAAAQNLLGTDASTNAANSAAQLTNDDASGFGNKFNFNRYPVGQTTGTVTSTVIDPAYYAAAADAIGSTTPTGSEVSGAMARHVRVTVTGQTQLLFWSLLPFVSDRNIEVRATAVAGMSAPLCQACGIEPIALAAQDASDTADFGFVQGIKYSLSFLCNGAPTPAILAPAARQTSWLLINRLDANTTVFADDSTQAFRMGAGGIPANRDSNQACLRVNNTETPWLSATINACTMSQVAPPVTSALCGLDTRFESTTTLGCSAIPDVDTLTTSYQPDTDVNDYDTYTDYTGNGRRLITVPIVDSLNGGTGTMTVLGFRQFLLSPAAGSNVINTQDVFGRFVAQYLGTVAPVKQGRFDGCTLTSGPGKVVLHQ